MKRQRVFFFPTAQENFEYHERLFAELKNGHLVDDIVVLVENFPTHSMVHTEGRKSFKASNVIFASGLTRPQNKLVKELDFNTMKNKTLVFNHIGDTTNLFLAKALPRGNKAFLINNGFIALDKGVAFEVPGPKNWKIPFGGIRTGKKYFFDPAFMESHATEKYWPSFYTAWFSLAWSVDPRSWFAKVVHPNLFYALFPETYRYDALGWVRQSKAGFCNGAVGIKYYPIDTYKSLFGDALEENIKKGYLLNDITFWHTQGLAKTIPRDKAVVDRENKILTVGKEKISFDHFIDGGKELPQLPKIVSIEKDGTEKVFCYHYRKNFLGVVPSDLKNIFFIGFTRPFSGGIANINEMQSLMIHKLLSQSHFKADLYDTIESKIEAYNSRFYAPNQKCGKTDHLVSYGLYNEEVAKFIGINRPLLKSAFSWNLSTFIRNLKFELYFPNCSPKFRIDGEYKVDGVEEYARSVFSFMEDFDVMMFATGNFFFDLVLVLQCLLMFLLAHGSEAFQQVWTSLPRSSGQMQLLAETDFEGPFPKAATELAILVALSGLVSSIALRSLCEIFFLSYSLPLPFSGPKFYFQPWIMVLIALRGEWYWCLVLAAFFGVVGFVGRQFSNFPFSGRYLFVDSKFKHKYASFWEEYKEIFNKVQDEKVKN